MSGNHHSPYVVLFMKGQQDDAACGFLPVWQGFLKTIMNRRSLYRRERAGRTKACAKGIKEFSDWPPFRRLYVKANFVAASDIITGNDVVGRAGHTAGRKIGVGFDKDAATGSASQRLRANSGQIHRPNEKRVRLVARCTDIRA